MLILDNVTLITVDGVDPDLCQKSLMYCAKKIQFSSIKLLSFKNPNKEEKNIEYIKIPKLNWNEYNRFIIRNLNSYVSTNYCLLIQTDGFVINPGLWTDDFLKYDFIGAPLSDYPAWLESQTSDFKTKFFENNFSESRWPMNGGFSLRSKHLLELSAKCPGFPDNIAEDIYITLYYRNWFEQNNAKFAPRSLAYSFSKENPLQEGEYDFLKCFGFHGKFSPMHCDLMKRPFNMKSKIDGLRKAFHIHPDISLKRYLDLTLKKFFNRMSRNDYFDYYKFYAPPKEQVRPEFNVEIDLVITVIEKDLAVLPFTIEYARKNILHTFRNVYLIAPDKEVFKDFCKWHNCEYINETELLSIRKQDIQYSVKGNDRSGWLFQQLLKFNSDKFCKSENICILDADTVLIRPRLFIKGNKKILDFSDEMHMPYVSAYEKLTGFIHKSPVSFVCHNMLFEKKKLKELREHIEKVTQKDFNNAILGCIDENENSCFSEYETYANFVLKKYRSEYKIEYWNNISLKNNLINSIDYFSAFYKPSNIKSISFHDYNS